MTYFLDTNIISYLLKGNKSILQNLDTLAENDNEISIPSIAYYEIKRGLLANNATTKLTRFLKFVEVIGIVELTAETLDIAAQIYTDLKKTGKPIEDDDLFIGASALEHNAVLITNNERKHISADAPPCARDSLLRDFALFSQLCAEPTSERISAF